MRHAALLVALLASPVAFATHPVGTEGPFYGDVRQDELDLHRYDNNPHGDPCVDVIAQYTVTLTYSPASDTLGLGANGYRTLGADGFAQVSFLADYCTAFDIEVAGVAVLDVASYKVVVERTV